MVLSFSRFSCHALTPLPQTLAVFIGLLCAQTVVAQTALSNLGQPLSSGSYTAGGHVNAFSFGEAVNFTTGPSAVDFTGATFLLFSVSLMLRTPAST